MNVKLFLNVFKIRKQCNTTYFYFVHVLDNFGPKRCNNDLKEDIPTLYELRYKQGFFNFFCIIYDYKGLVM